MAGVDFRFKKCPKCSQIIIEYTSIPVYLCGGCGAVLRAKGQASNCARSVSSSDEGEASSGVILERFRRGVSLSYDELQSARKFPSSSESSLAEATAVGGIYRLPFRECGFSAPESRSRVLLPKRKHILRAVDGAAPFMVCDGCFNLLQVPTVVLCCRRKFAKLQCGNCARVMMSTGQEGKGTNGTGASVTTEEYGPPPSNSCYSSDTENNSTAVALHRLMGYGSARDLLWNSCRFDDGYESFESMVPYSRRRFRRENGGKD